MNVLGWKTEEYELGYVAEKLTGYVFTVDGKPLEFNDFIPLDGHDIEEAGYLSDTQSVESAPYLACCTCGIIECDAVQAIVKFEGDSVAWSAFRYYYGKPTTLGEYRFGRAQYCETIRSLLEHVKKASSSEGH